MTGKKKFQNTKRSGFLETLPVLDVESSGLISRSKFNFSFLDFSQPEVCIPDKLSGDFLSELVSKLKSYSAHPLSYWLHQRVGGGGRSILEIYKKFPNPSGFFHPSAVPHDAEWARFRMEGAVRLVGFIIPSSLSNKLSNDRKYSFCTNTFYVVFIDLEHNFYGG